MMIYLTAIFRVVGSWTLFQEIQTQVKPSLYQIFSEGRTEYVRQRVQRLNNLSRASLVVYMLLDAQLTGISICIVKSGGQMKPFQKFVYVEAIVLLCIYQIYLSLVATWMIRKLGLSKGVKWLLIVMVWLLATTYVLTEIDGILNDHSYLFSTTIH